MKGAAQEPPLLFVWLFALGVRVATIIEIRPSTSALGGSASPQPNPTNIQKRPVSENSGAFFQSSDFARGKCQFLLMAIKRKPVASKAPAGTRSASLKPSWLPSV